MEAMRLSRGVGLLCFLVAVIVSTLGGSTGHKMQETSSGLPTVKRILVEREDNSSESANIFYARTERIDPLDDFKKYRGGYNITNKHYWSSVMFTSKYGYSIAALWLLIGSVYSITLLIKNICFTKKGRRASKKLPCSKRHCFWPVLLGFFLTFLAIITSGVVLGGSSKFHSRATKIKNIVVETAQEASGTIHNVTKAVRAMQGDSELSGELDVSIGLNSTSQKLSDDADSIQRKAEKNMRLINKGLKILKIVTIVTITLNLITILALLASQSLKLHQLFHLLMVLCWLFTFFFWVYFGLYFFLNKFAGDTCTALDDYRQDPQTSSLGSILPCDDHISAKLVLHDTAAGIHDIIDQVNANISGAQSYLPALEYVCNPFSGPPEYNYQPENCSSNTIQIGDIPQILKRYACLGSDGGSCKQGEFISASDYSRVLAYTNSIQNILNAYPGVESLVNCQLVKDAFSEILLKHCKPLKKYVHMTWASLAVLSTIMVALLLIAIVEAHHDGSCPSSEGSVRPNSAPTDASEVDTTQMAPKQIELKSEP